MAKNPMKLYKYCPICGKNVKRTESNCFHCESCNFNLYINPVPANGVILENEKGEILLVKRKYAPKKGWWDVPGGFIQPHETLEASVMRELKEELDIGVSIDRIVGIYSDYYDYQNIHYSTLGIILVAHIRQGHPRSSDDVASFKYFPKDTIGDVPIAFKTVRQALRDYINRATSSPNFTA